MRDMNEEWKELKETITELRDNNGICTQQEVCKFLVTYMNVLEKGKSLQENNNRENKNIMDIIEEKIKEMSLNGTRDSDLIEIGMRLCYSFVLDYLTEEELLKIRK